MRRKHVWTAVVVITTGTLVLLIGTAYAAAAQETRILTALPDLGVQLTPAVWLAGVSAMLGAVLLLAARHWRSRGPTS